MVCQRAGSGHASGDVNVPKRLNDTCRTEQGGDPSLAALVAKIMELVPPTEARTVGSTWSTEEPANST